MARPWQRLPQLLSDGRFDIVLAVLLAILAIFLGWRVGSPLGVALDLAACVAAGLTVRWPRVAGAALGAILLLYLVAPTRWAEMGEYAALIPILGAGLRGQRRQRAWMTAGYGAILAGVMYRTYPGDPLFLLGTLVWAVLIGVLWLIGSLFVAFQRALAQAQAGALLEQRLATARQIHDTTARTLARTLMAAERARSDRNVDLLVTVASGIQQAILELRWTLSSLREAPSTPDEVSATHLGEAIDKAVGLLRERGFPIAVTLEGDLSRISGAVEEILVATVGEACANIERHGAPGLPAALLLSADADVVDMLTMNEVGDDSSPPERLGMGLLGVRERLAGIGGRLETRQEGSKWIMQVTAPLETT